MSKTPPRKKPPTKPPAKPRTKKAPEVDIEATRHPVAGETYADHMARFYATADVNEVADFLSRIAVEADPSKPGYSPAATGPLMEGASRYLAGLSPKQRGDIIDALMGRMMVPADQIARMPMSQKVGILPESMQSAFMPDEAAVPGVKPDMEFSLLPEPPAPKAKADKRSPAIREAARKGMEGLKPAAASRILEGVDERGRRIQGGITREKAASGQVFESPAAPPAVPPAKDVVFGRGGVRSEAAENIITIPPETSPEQLKANGWTQRDLDRGFRRINSRAGQSIEVLHEKRAQLTEGRPAKPLQVPPDAPTRTVRRAQGKKAEVFLDPDAPESGVRMVPDWRAADNKAAIEAEAEQLLADFLSGASGRRAADAEVQSLLDAGNAGTERGVTPDTAEQMTMESAGTPGAIYGADDTPEVMRLATHAGSEVARQIRDRTHGSVAGASRKADGMSPLQQENARIRQLIAIAKGPLTEDGGAFDNQNAILRSQFAAEREFNALASAGIEAPRPDTSILEAVRRDLRMGGASAEELIEELSDGYRLRSDGPLSIGMSGPLGVRASHSIPGEEGIVGGNVWSRPGASSLSGTTDVREAMLRHVLENADPAASEFGIRPEDRRGLDLDRVLGGVQRARLETVDARGRKVPVESLMGWPEGSAAFSGETLAHMAAAALAGRRGLPAGTPQRWAPAFQQALLENLTAAPSDMKRYGEAAAAFANTTLRPQSKRARSVLRGLAAAADEGQLLADNPDLAGLAGAAAASPMSAADLYDRIWTKTDGTRWSPSKTQVRVPSAKADTGGGYTIGKPVPVDASDYAVPAGQPIQGGEAPSQGGMELMEPLPYDPKDYEVAYPADDEYVYARPPINRDMLQQALLSGLLA